MGTNIKVIAALIVAVVGVCVGAYFLGRKHELVKSFEVEKTYIHQVDSLTNLIDRLENFQIVQLVSQKDSLERLLVGLEIETKQVKKEYDEQISKIRTYTNPDLDKFFSDRYSTD